MTKEELIDKNLIHDGYLKTPALIEAFRVVLRADFVPDGSKAYAYENTPLPIGHGQTISQPLTVAFMLELLEPKPGEKILDIGVGSGWQTALLAQCVSGPVRRQGETEEISENAVAGKVVGIERIPELKVFAEKNISKYPFLQNGVVRLIESDGTEGYAAEAPYDKIISGASGKTLPPAWKDQLKIGGRIVAPIGESVYVFDKIGKDEFVERQFPGFVFVPLISA